MRKNKKKIKRKRNRKLLRKIKAEEKKRKNNIKAYYIRDFSTLVRKFVDEAPPHDIRIYTLLGFFHRTYLKILEILSLRLDPTLLNISIGNYIKNESNKPEPSYDSDPLAMRIDCMRLGELFLFYDEIVRQKRPDPRLLMYLFGFCQALLNRMMRKLGINYQLAYSF